MGEGVCEEPLGGLIGEEERGVGGECSDEGGGEAAVEGGGALAGQDAAPHPHHAALLTPHLQWSELSHLIQNIIGTRRRLRAHDDIKISSSSCSISSMHHFNVKCRCLCLA